MKLRDYQIDALNRVRASMARGNRRVVVVLPTSAGKTVLFSEMARRAIERGKRVLVLAHRTELVDQAIDEMIGLGLPAAAVCASSLYPPNPFAPVQVASVQTLLARDTRPHADLVIADESHHYVAESFNSLLSHYESAYVIGATATPERGDGRGLGELFDDLVIGASIKQLTEQGWIVPCRILRPSAPLKPGELAQSPVDAYAEHAMGRFAIVFARRVDLAEQYAAEFNAKGISAQCLHGKTPTSERRAMIEEFKAGRIHVLSSVGVATEGFNATIADCCILARGCGSTGLYLQMGGRILRLHPGKTDALMLDLRGVSHEHGKLEDDREYSLDGRGIRLKDAVSLCPVCKQPREPPEACPNCGYVASNDAGGNPDTVVGEKLVPYASKRAEGEEDRLKTAARWYASGVIGNGYKLGWLFAKWKSVYGESLSNRMLDAAKREARSYAPAPARVPDVDPTDPTLLPE